jgi:DNA-binding transcriptional ArsR family regulator
MSDVVTIDRAEQLRALGHTLRLRVLEVLGDGEELTNRQLAQRLGVDPGHLHFHVRLLLKAGLIELAPGRSGREKPYRAVSPTIRVSPELLNSAAASDVHGTLLKEVERGWATFAAGGRFRSAQLTIRLDAEAVRKLFRELVEKAARMEDPVQEPLVVSFFTHPALPTD